MKQYGLCCLVGAAFGLTLAAAAGAVWVMFGGETFIDQLIDLDFP